MTLTITENGDLVAEGDEETGDLVADNDQLAPVTEAQTQVSSLALVLNNWGMQLCACVFGGGEG